MPRSGEPVRYCAYVLRCWREQVHDARLPAGWRFSLEEIEGGKRHGFGTFEALVAFLEAELEDGSDEAARDGAPESGMQEQRS